MLNGARHEPDIRPMRGAALSPRSPVPDALKVRANRLDLVQRLAVDLAHEIKNPLHSMVINLEVLRRRIARPGGSEPDELMRYTNVLSSELERVNRRIEVLLSIVKPDRSAEPVTLRDATEEVLDILEIERERRHIRIVFEPVAAHARGTLQADTARQLVLDVLLSVMDSVDDGAEVVVRTEVEPGWSRLHVAAPGWGGAALAMPNLAVASAIASELGGELDESGDALVLSVPLP